MKQQSKNVEAIYPLSPLQEGMLFHSIYNPDSGVYVTQACLTLEGSLNAAGFRRAWQRVTARHSILRSAFVWEGLPKPHQVVHKRVELPWQTLDWRDHPESEIEARLSAFLAQDQTQGFKLSQAPLMRFALIQVSAERYYFVWSHHHILIDGWSLPLIFNDLMHFYLTPTKRLPKPKPYQAYIQWLQKQDRNSAETYWRDALQGITTPTPLPLSLTRSEQPDQFGEQQFEVEASTTATLQQLARDHRLTVNNFVQGAWAFILSRYSGESDVVFGAALSSRPPELEGMEKMVGLFLNNLPVRIQVAEEMHLLDWLQTIQAGQLAREQYAHTPLVDIQGWSEVPRALPLFESHVAFESYPFDDSSQEKQQTLQVTDVQMSSYTNSGIVVRVIPGESLIVDFVYDASRFESATITAVGEQFVHLLTQFAAQPTQTLSAYSLLTTAAQAILPDPQDPIAAPVQTPITSLIAKRAAEMPTHNAIVSAEQQKSYAELYASAQQIAHKIVAAGIQTGDVIAVYGSRTYGTIASMIGVFLSGGVLLNLADNLPLQRQQVMLREANAKLLVNVGMNVDALAFEHGTLSVAQMSAEMMYQSYDASAESDIITTQSEQTVLPTIKGTDAAYIFFTSGTTGVPKGVLGNHKGLAHFLAWQRETFNVQPTDRCAQLTALSFDVVMRDIFMPLTSGATLCLPEAMAILEPERLLAWLDAEAITLLHTVPSLAQAWIMQPSAQKSSTLRCAFFAGEPLTDTLVNRWRDYFTACEVVNIYGPTETTLAKCYYRVPASPFPGVQPVGQPLPQTQALVLGKGNRRCGIGEQGEIVLRTPFCTYGYINVPAEQSRFAPSPFRDDESDLFYYTGDRGRYRADGTLNILGRMDDQVKIRGVRIELGEIKALLDDHDLVWESFVMATDVDGEKALVAYLVPMGVCSAESASLAQTLHQYLSDRLSAAMIPSAFVALDKLPLTPNGKINRRALPAPSQPTAADTSEQAVSPRTETEEQVAAIWCKVLKRESIGVHENFFAIGGHSLMATQVVGRIRRTFDIKFSLRSFFDEPTIATVAELVDLKLLEQLEDGDLEALLATI